MTRLQVKRVEVIQTRRRGEEETEDKKGSENENSDKSCLSDSCGLYMGRKRHDMRYGGKSAQRAGVEGRKEKSDKRSKEE